MIRSVLFFLVFCSPLVAQQTQTALSTSTTAPSAQAAPQADEHPANAGETHKQILKEAKTVYISSNTAFLTVDTMYRALLKQKDWEKLNLNIVTRADSADLDIHIDRLIFTHIHIYTITDRKTGIILASGRETSFDGITASGGIAKQIVQVFSTARLPREDKKQ
jgi:hypothetical protein